VSWTYSGDPSTSDLDAVRFWMQDIDERRQLLQNEDINYLLNTWMPNVNSVVFVASVGCEVIAARYADEVQVSADGVSVGVGELQEKYMALAEQLRDQYDEDKIIIGPGGGSGGGGSGGDGSGGGGSGGGGAGGWNDSLWGVGHDSTIAHTRFGIGHMDNAWAGRQDFGGYDPGNQPGTFYPYGAAYPSDALIRNVAENGKAAQHYKAQG